MKSKIKIVLILVLFSTNLYAQDIMITPTHDKALSGFNVLQYGWMHQYKNYFLLTISNKTATDFINSEELERYFNLRLRNLISGINIIKQIDLNTRKNVFMLNLYLYKYNDNLSIYYGLIEFQARGDSGVMYRITNSIAGSETQIARFVKDNIDNIVEKFAEDYYYIKDLLTNQCP